MPLNASARRLPAARCYWPMTLKNPATEEMGLVAEVLVLVAVIGPPTFVQVFNAAATLVLLTTW